MGNFMTGLKNATNFTYTENGALTHKTTTSDLYDMFALGGAMRSRSDEDCILMFRKAFAENPTYALKCLFYLRDCRGGQGERRFWRVCMADLARKNPDAARRNLKMVLATKSSQRVQDAEKEILAGDASAMPAENQ